MIRALRQRLHRWIATRTPRVPGPWRIHRRRVYIVPTRYGYGYGLLLFTMLLGAMNYSNSMAFALTFLLAGVGLLAMHDTHANLVNLSIAAEPVAPVFAGDELQFRLRLDNPSRHARHAIGVHWPAVAAGQQVDIAAGETARLTLSLASTRRGWLPASRFAVATAFPLGLFQAWTWLELDIAGLVYPRPAEAGSAPPPGLQGDGAQREARPGIDSFVGLRGYRPGDPLQAIDWKSLARQPPPLGQPQIKQFAEPAAGTLWLDWQALPAEWPVEQRLAQLARWVLDAEAQQRRYGLRLPRRVCPPGSGSSHRHACLAALALF
ncbi:DUF58 domain-containing protein [Nevskia sp.]|uniref:DUF58 domain-containing protein n=1 Tax=Nevskia sp. TaxID=1929292 RepID=UPI003F71B940